MSAQTDLISSAARHYAAGEFPRAERLALEILRSDPIHAEAWRLLGGLAFKRNDPARGFDCLTRSIQCNPTDPDGWFSLGDFYRIAGDVPAAIRTFEHVVRLRPEFVEAHLRLAHLHRQSNSPKAAVCFEQAARCAPNNAEITFQFASYLHQSGRWERAISAFHDVLRLDPAHFAAATELGRTLAEQGRIDEAIAQFRTSLGLNPNQPNIYFLLSQLAADGWCTLTTEEIVQIGGFIANPQCPAAERRDYAFAAAVHLREQGAYDDAMHYYHLANSLKRQSLVEQNVAFDARRHESMIEKTIATYDRSYFGSVRGWGVDSEVPIFIVGMPRSGSTLVEQILANHPRVFGAGEIGDMLAVIGRSDPLRTFDPYAVPSVDGPAAAQQLGTGYLDWIRSANRDAVRITNKTLQNFLYLGLIATLFPRARIIHCRRDPIDVCLACYFANFNFAPFTCSFDDIGVYHRTYERLMAHWTRVLPLAIHEVRYESLVDHPRPVIEAMLEHCGLEWDERCVEFHKSRRVVTTASAGQVRKPIYRNAIGRWRNFRKHLEPLISALGMTDGGAFAADAAAMGVIAPDDGITGTVRS